MYNSTLVFPCSREWLVEKTNHGGKIESGYFKKGSVIVALQTGGVAGFWRLIAEGLMRNACGWA